MARGKRQRKVLLALGVMAGVLCVLLISLPVWFPWILRPVARWQGGSFGRYEREGYSRFALNDVRFTNYGIGVRAERVEAFVPSVWLWKVFRNPKSEAPTTGPAGGAVEQFVRVRNWDLEVLPSTSTNASVYSSAQDARNILTFLKRWLPRAVVTGGRMHSGNTFVAVPQANWSGGTLTGQVELPRQVSAAVSLQGNEAQVYHVKIDSARLDLHSDIEVVTNSSGLAIQATNTWRTNRFEARVQFGRSGLLPENASLEAPEIRVPSKLLNLGFYQGVAGGVSAKWENGAFVLDVHGSAIPAGNQANLPPLQLEIHASGNTNLATIERALISAPWLRVELSQHLNVYFTGQPLRERARVTLTADLSRQSRLPLKGRLSGEADLEPGAGEIPAAQFHLTGSGIGNSMLVAKQVNLDGNLSWPWLEMSNLVASFDDGSKASGRGKFELEKETIEGGELQFNGLLIQRWLPTNYSIGGLSISARASGPVTNLSHSGRLEVTNFTAPQMRPMQLAADWNGQQEEFAHAEATATVTGASLYAAGWVTNRGGDLELRLDSLTLSTNRVSELNLEKPWFLSLKHFGSNGVYQIEETPFDLSGTGGRVHVEGELGWPTRGRFRVSMQNLSSSEVGPFLKASAIPTIELPKLQGKLEWSNSPAKFEVELLAQGMLPSELVASGTTKAETLAALDRERQEQLAAETNRSLPAQGRYRLQLNVTGDEKGITVSNLSFSSGGSLVTEAHGFLPVWLVPGQWTNFVHLETHEPMGFEARAGPEAFFWEKLGTLAGVSLQEPNLDVNVSGSWELPKGEVSLRAGGIQLTQTNMARLNLRDLVLDLSLERERARLVKGEVLVEGQPVSLTGELPLGKSFWTELEQGKLPNLENASARLRIERARLAGAAELLPSFMMAEGEVDADLSLLPGGQFEGTLAIHGARTRPLGTVGPLRHIEINLRAHDRRLIMQESELDLGGSTVTLGGGLDLGGTEWLKGKLPTFQVAVFGTNVPLSRQPTSIIRSSFQLAVTRTNGAPPIVTGLVRLQDSFFLSDLTALIPGKVSTPQGRPPYFSIDDPLVADWRLAVRVQGPGFLRVRSAPFNGQVSADLRLQGTLREPVALGDIKIDSGVVRFPFASLAVQQGFVTLTSENPYHPVLSVSATSKQFGYNIRMEVSGPIDEPILQFTSTPPLSSEQILLMVTAGQLPAGEFTMTTQQRAQAVAVFLGRDLLAKFGLEDQAEERLTIRSGEQITEQGRPTYAVEFKLTPRWSVYGEYDRFGDYNGMFKWLIYSK